MNTTTQPRGERPRGATASGRLHIHPRGFGFIERTGSDDIFVPAPKLAGLLDGDLVEARTRRGKRDGERIVVSIRTVERGRASVLGEVVRPGVVRIDPGVSVDEVAVDGLASVGELVRLAPGDDGSWCVVERCGESRSDSGFALRFFDRYRLPIGYDQTVVADGAHIVRRAGEARRTERPQRVRIVERCVFTVDEDHSADLDDALDAVVEDDGAIRVFVHIADVTEHVAVGSVVDRAAADMPTSVYLPQLVRHMLPPSIGADALSLLPGVERDTMTVELRIDQDGQVVSVDVYESTITSVCRLDYAAVERALDGDRERLDERAGHHSNDVAASVRLLWAAACRLSLTRSARGGVDVVRDDSQDEAGNVRAHQMVERLMVAANEAVAQWLIERNIPAVFRNHPGIDEVGVEALRATLRNLHLADVVPTPLTPAGFAAIAAQVPEAGRPLFGDTVLSVLGRASYATVNDGHFGLGSDGYVHFTSPLRRYADMCIHRIVKRYLAGEREVAANVLDGFVERINDATKRAAWAERDGVKARTLAALQPGASVDGRIGSVNGETVKIDVMGVLCTVRANDLRHGDTVIEVGGIVPLVVRRACPVQGVLEVRHRAAPAGSRKRSGPVARADHRPSGANRPARSVAGGDDERTRKRRGRRGRGGRESGSVAN